MAAYYNENDPKAVARLRELVREGAITDGEIDDRSITEVSPEDLAGFERVHLFAGIGGWDLACTWAGWEGPAWTGSCPCQPFSVSGDGKAHADERHLWPAFHRLVAERRPPVVFGEQVSNRLGQVWLSAVRLDVEATGYACGSVDLPAACVGAPHIRNRLWWVARDLDARFLPDAHGAWPGSPAWRRTQGELVVPERGQAPGLDPDDRRAVPPVAHPDGRDPAARQELGIRAHPFEPQDSQLRERSAAILGVDSWDTGEWFYCSDGYLRPSPGVESGILPMVDGVPDRLASLRAYGNAIVPELAAEFIDWCRDALVEMDRNK